MRPQMQSMSTEAFMYSKAMKNKSILKDLELRGRKEIVENIFKGEKIREEKRSRRLTTPFKKMCKKAVKVMESGGCY